MRRPAGLPQSSLTQVLVNGAAEQSQVVAEQAQVCHTPSALQLHLTHRRFLRWRRASGQVWMDVVNKGQGSGGGGAQELAVLASPTHRRRFVACALAAFLLLLAGTPARAPCACGRELAPVRKLD
jgi:hypothetical protein